LPCGDDQTAPPLPKAKNRAWKGNTCAGHVERGAGTFVLKLAQPVALVDAVIEARLLRDLVAIRA
jgi:hypothetical protein